MTISAPDNIAAEVIESPASDWILDAYLPYALYTIRARALLLDDGLKPVNRRILWALWSKGITPKAQHLKAARAAGDAMAYHPHGGSSIEDALAKMAQGFVQRVPLIDPEGSVGKVAGDLPAAARYWECRLTPAAVELLKEIDKGAVPLSKNFDGTLPEPHRLPARWPVSIINGTTGIAVGYSASMWPHNPTETLKAAIAVLRNPNITTKALMKIMPGPDFPQGGELFGTDGVFDYMDTGVGTFTIRGRYSIEKLPRGRAFIIFNELPYGVSAEDVIKKVRALQESGKSKMSEISEIKDLTDRKHGMKLRFATKSGTNPESIVAELFAKTAAETKFPTRSTVIVDGSPVVQNMREQLQSFIELRRRSIRNRSSASLGIIEKRLLQIGAILAATLDIDKAISIIRNSEEIEDARKALCKHFKLSSEQADYILSMQLRRLTKADSIELNEEKKKLEEELAHNKEILANQEKLDFYVEEEIKEVSKIVGDPRRTVISGYTTQDLKDAAKELQKNVKESEKDSPIFVSRLADGTFVKHLDRDLNSTASSTGSLDFGLVAETISTTSQSSIAVITADGNAKVIPVSFILSDKPTTATVLGLPRKSKIVGVSKMSTGKNEVGLAMFTKLGSVKIAKTNFPKGAEEFPVISLDEGDELVGTLWVSAPLKGVNFVAVAKSGNALKFDAETIRVSGSAAGGVRGMKLKSDEDEILAFALLRNEGSIVTSTKKTLKVTPLFEIPSKGKGGMGVVTHPFRANEPNELRTAFVGETPAATIAGTTSVAPLPSPSARNVRGGELLLNLDFGNRIADQV